jgi:hypothetical protein
MITMTCLIGVVEALALGGDIAAETEVGVSARTAPTVATAARHR